MENNDNIIPVRGKPINSIIYNLHSICTMVLKSYCEECQINAAAYEYDYGDNKIIIYTNKPGLMIGFHGVTVEKYQQIFSKALSRDVKIEFKEIRGGFVVADNLSGPPIDLFLRQLMIDALKENEEENKNKE